MREAWAIQNTTNLMNAALECTPLPGPFRGLQRAANSANIKLGQQSKRHPATPKALHLQWRSGTAQPPLPDVPVIPVIPAAPLPALRPGTRRYDLRPR